MTTPRAFWARQSCNWPVRLLAPARSKARRVVAPAFLAALALERARHARPTPTLPPTLPPTRRRHAVDRPELGCAVTAGLRDAMAAHDEIEIPRRCEEDNLKRVTGNILGSAPSVVEAARMATGAVATPPAKGQERQCSALLTASQDGKDEAVLCDGRG